MRPPVIRVGERYGLLVVLRRDGSKRGRRLYECRCDCGNLTRVDSDSLRSEHTRSCGCRERLTHGHGRRTATSPTYSSWRMMLRRCRNPADKDWVNYGGRGITVCKRWEDFAAFLADMGERTEGTSIDRIDNDGNYEPGNCRWATRMEQRASQRAPRKRNKRDTAVTQNATGGR